MDDASKNLYLRVQMPLDFVYPLVMAAVFFLIFCKVWKRFRPVLAALPLLLVLFDWAENASVILMFTKPGLVNRIASAI